MRVQSLDVPKLPSPYLEVLQREVGKLQRQDEVVAIGLAGSVARGDFWRGSDLDIEVILKGDRPKNVVCTSVVYFTLFMSSIHSGSLSKASISQTFSRGALISTDFITLVKISPPSRFMPPGTDSAHFLYCRSLLSSLVFDTFRVAVLYTRSNPHSQLLSKKESLGRDLPFRVQIPTSAF